MTTIALPTAERTEEQYSLAKILTIWAVVSLPMPILAFVVAPALYSRIDLLPGIVYWVLMILGMMWQFVVSLIIVYRELGTLRWSAIRERTWLTTPRDPQTGRSRPVLFWWLVPAFLFAGFVILGMGSYLESVTAWLFPTLLQLPSLSLEELNTPRADRSMVAGSSGNREFTLQLFFGGRVSLSRRSAAKDAGCFWQMGLGHERCSIWRISPA